MERVDPVVHLAQPDTIRVEHRTAPPAGEAVAVDVDDVDVRRAQRSAVLEHARTFIDECVDRALLDLLVGDRAPQDSRVGGAHPQRREGRSGEARSQQPGAPLVCRTLHVANGQLSRQLDADK